MVASAYRMFAERGYGVPLGEVAADAGVSVQNLYLLFQNKQNLVHEALQLAVLGDDQPEPPHRRPWFQEVVNAARPGPAIRVWVDNTLPIYARVAPLAGMFQSEPEVADIWANSERLRYEGFLEVMQLVATKGRFRKGVDMAQAADVIFVLLSPMVYQEFVGGRGWKPEAWGAWVADLVTAALFVPARR
ncbi:MAG: hypothetical protein QOE92_2399 [Chloroflexota bacterium]|nr:hypothetical protein [Chloroflexota bacterium]